MFNKLNLAEFLYSDDIAEACWNVMNLSEEQFKPLLASNRNDGLPPFNVGYGEEVSVKELAETVGYKGTLQFDTTKLDGTMRKLMDSGSLNTLGWFARTDLLRGLQLSYQNYLTIRDAK